MLTNEEVKAILEQSFRPFAGVVHIRSGEHIRFKVMKNSHRIYEELGIPLSDLRENAILTALIIRVSDSSNSSRMTCAGYKLVTYIGSAGTSRFGNDG